MPRFCCINIADFPAWAAARHDPALQEPARRDKPVLIYRNGRVVAASPAARVSGVQTGWSLPRAQALLPEAVALPHHAALTALAWQEVLQALYELTPYLESIRPGLAIASIRPPGAVTAHVQSWGAQAGVADDRTTAELLALAAKPGELRELPPGTGMEFLRQASVRYLMAAGVSAATIERLGWFGWHTVGALHPVTRQQLRAQFPESDILFRYAQARDVRPVAMYWPPPVLEAHYEFDDPVCEPWEWEPILDYLLEQVCEPLAGRSVRTITVSLEAPRGGTQPMRRLSRKRLLREPVASLARLRDEACQILSALQHSLYERQRTAALTRLEVELGGLEDTYATQHNLFAERPTVHAVLAALEDRFPGSVQRVVMIDRDAYLPEAAFRLVPLTPEDLTPPRVLAKARSRRTVPRLAARRRATARRAARHDQPQLTLTAEV